MPMPLYDAAQSLKPQTEQYLRKVTSFLTVINLIYFTENVLYLLFLPSVLYFLNGAQLTIQWKYRIPWQKIN